MKIPWKSVHPFCLMLLRNIDSENRKKSCTQGVKHKIPKIFHIVSCINRFLRLRDFTRSCSKMPVRLVKKGPGRPFIYPSSSLSYPNAAYLLHYLTTPFHPTQKAPTPYYHISSHLLITSVTIHVYDMPWSSIHSTHFAETLCAVSVLVKLTLACNLLLLVS